MYTIEYEVKVGDCFTHDSILYKILELIHIDGESHFITRTPSGHLQSFKVTEVQHICFKNNKSFIMDQLMKKKSTCRILN